ncbi:MAG TPA: GTP-binding protein, partial [Microlunatus sp.]
MRTLNLGILAHVDAGKTSLTERLLYAAGVIDHIGRVDDGDTQTDTLALERQRGITIKSAVTSFMINDITVNLIDTPGHPDFIAEVERVLDVLDGVVLVISAVEGVQAQTRVLMRALQRLELPVLIFVNKIDRAGAQSADLVPEIERRLGITGLPMGTVYDAGRRNARYVADSDADPEVRLRMADALTKADDQLLADYLAAGDLPADRLRAALTAQTRTRQLHPVFFGSAVTGAGVPELMSGIGELLPAREPARTRAGAVVFKIDRGPQGEKICYLRVFGGDFGVRDVVPIWSVDGSLVGESKITAAKIFANGA